MILRQSSGLFVSFKKTHSCDFFGTTLSKQKMLTRPATFTTFGTTQKMPPCLNRNTAKLAPGKRKRKFTNHIRERFFTCRHGDWQSGRNDSGKQVEHSQSGEPPCCTVGYKLPNSPSKQSKRDHKQHTDKNQSIAIELKHRWLGIQNLTNQFAFRCLKSSSQHKSS